jgi:hypothetical protein
MVLDFGAAPLSFLRCRLLIQCISPPEEVEVERPKGILRKITMIM